MIMETKITNVKNSEIEVRRYPILQVIADDNPPFYCLNEFRYSQTLLKLY
jgi:NAD+ kinase